MLLNNRIDLHMFLVWLYLQDFRHVLSELAHPQKTLVQMAMSTIFGKLY